MKTKKFFKKSSHWIAFGMIGIFVALLLLHITLAQEGVSALPLVPPPSSIPNAPAPGSPVSSIPNAPAPGSAPSSTPATNAAQDTKDATEDTTESALQKAPKLPKVACNNGKTYNLTLPPNLWIMVADGKSVHKKQLQEMEKHGLIKNPVAIIKNRKPNILDLDYTVKIETPQEESFHVPSGFDVWLLYTTRDGLNKIYNTYHPDASNPEKTVNFPGTLGEGDVKEKHIEFTCNFTAIALPSDPSPSVYTEYTEESPLPLNELKTLSGPLADQIIKQLQGVWLAKAVASGKSIEDRYMAFVRNKICLEIYFDDSRTVKCLATYDPYVLTNKNTLVFDLYGETRRIWNFTLNGKTLEIKSEGENKIIYQKTTVPITKQIVQDSLIQAPRISNVQVTAITDHSAKITWTTDVPAKTGLNYKAAGARGGVGGSTEELVQDHIVQLNDLESSTTFQFNVYSMNVGGTGKGADDSFTTLTSSQPQVSVSNVDGVSCDGKMYTISLPQGTELALIPLSIDDSEKINSLLSKKLILQYSEIVHNEDEILLNWSYSARNYFNPGFLTRRNFPLYSNWSQWLALIKEKDLPKLHQRLMSWYPVASDLTIQTLPKANQEGTSVEFSCQFPSE